MPAPGWLRPSLALLGGLMLVAGVVAIVIGLTAAAWLRNQIPGTSASAEVVGGAAVAFGAALLLLGLGHVALAVLIRRRPSRAVRAVGVVVGLALAMAVVVGLATVAVSLAHGVSAGPLLAAVPMLIALAVYSTLAVSLLGADRV